MPVDYVVAAVIRDMLKAVDSSIYRDMMTELISFNA